MPRTIFANDDLLDYLTSLANPTGYTIGLILGQVSFDTFFSFFSLLFKKIKYK